MEHSEQIDALYNELAKILDRFSEEFDISGADKVWVLHCLINETTDVNLDFEAEIQIEDDEEGSN